MYDRSLVSYVVFHLSVYLQAFIHMLEGESRGEEKIVIDDINKMKHSH